MKSYFIISITALSFISFSFQSCKKEEPDTEAQSALDNSFCEGEFAQIFTTIANYGVNEMGVRLPGGCPISYINPLDTVDGFPVRLELDYGSGCIDADGKTRKGKIYADFSTKWSNIANKPSVKLTFLNYQVNDVYLNSDSMIITRDAANAYTTKVVGAKVSNNSWEIQWASDHTITQSAGAGDTIASNDVFEFAGSTKGVNKKGKSFKTLITIPLKKSGTCGWLSKGRLDITPERLDVRMVDFGAGSCDNDATLTINGNIYTFLLE